MNTNEALAAIEAKAAKSVLKAGSTGIPVQSWAGIIAGRRVEVRTELGGTARYTLETMAGDVIATVDRAEALRLLG